MVTGKITGQRIGTNGAGTENVRILQVRLSDVEDIQEIEYFTQSGEDTAPAIGDKVLVELVGDSYKIVGNTKDLITPESDAGGKEFYSQAGGVKKARLKLLPDGKVSLGDGTDELIDLFDQVLTELQKSVDLGGTASTGTLFKINPALATIQGKLANIKV